MKTLMFLLTSGRSAVNKDSSSDSQTPCVHVSVDTGNNTCQYIHETALIDFIRIIASSMISGICFHTSEEPYL